MSGAAIRTAISKTANIRTSSFIDILSVSENSRQQDEQNRHEGAVGGCFKRVRSGE
jgi:hypothetical protein